jgi:hypothetical protein
MKTIHLTALDLDLEVPDTIHYHDDGFVENIEERTAFLIWKYTGKLDLSEKKQKVLIGRMFGTPAIHKEQHIHIYYKNRKRQDCEMWTRGHEELHTIRRMDYLMDSNTGITAFLIAALERKGVEINLQRIKKEIKDEELREEVIADLGGVFAVHQKYDLLSMGIPFSNYPIALAANYYFDMYTRTKLRKIFNRKSLLQKLTNFFPKS